MTENKHLDEAVSIVPLCYDEFDEPFTLLKTANEKAQNIIEKYDLGKYPNNTIYAYFVNGKPILNFKNIAENSPVLVREMNRLFLFSEA